MDPNFNLPPGVTRRDIDMAAGAVPAYCAHCGGAVYLHDLNERGHCDACARELEVLEAGE